MAKFLVERHLPGITPDQLTAAARGARDTARAMSDEGTDVAYLRSTFIPDGERCLCLFEASDSEVVKEANDRAGLPYMSITEAMHIASEDLS
jgi:hypothetical protein